MTISNCVQEMELGDEKLVLETGKLARRADGSVLVKLGQTHVLVTVVVDKNKITTTDFFPLTVNYIEKTYSAGKIPGGFFKREGRQSEQEILTSRLIDRPIRPLFPEGYFNTVQVIATVLSIDPDVYPDIPAMIGASAALSISGAPFQGPLAGVRIGYKDGMYITNPTISQMVDSELDLVIAGTKDSIVMVECKANEVSERVVMGALTYGHEIIKTLVNNISEFAGKVNKAPMEWNKPLSNDVLIEGLQKYKEELTTIFRITDKMQRVDSLKKLRDTICEEFVDDENDLTSKDVLAEVRNLEKHIVRTFVLSGEPRIDGRDYTTVRDISIEIGLLPRTHGSALFTRGETQALAVTTLGSDRDAQIIDGLQGEKRDRFFLHYNFPPYCVGEANMLFGPKRREIGHGNLARKAIEAVLPPKDEFPYVIRVVSEIMSCNGSSSMASVCGASLSLMDAGVPLKAQVSGVAMGLIKKDDKYVILTDILGDEDALGDMDFKVAGTRKGINALQMDIKIAGIEQNIMEEVLNQAKDARFSILDNMDSMMDAPRGNLSEFAPQIFSMKIATDKIKDVIGKGGATIRGITEQTGATIDIEDTGDLKIFASDSNGLEKAKAMVNDIVAEIEVGKIYDGKVVKIVDFGAFVAIKPGTEGLLHISQITEERVEDVRSHYSEGDSIKVKVLDVDRSGRIKLTARGVVA